MTKLGPQKKRRTCIFCPSDNVSKEHVWSTWLHQHLRGTWTDSYTEFSHHQANRGAAPITSERSRQGHTATIKVRAPCKACNNGWMNRLEADARPYLTPLVEGMPVTLFPDAVELVAQWIVMKAVVCEHMRLDEFVTPRADRQEFAKSRRIPPYFRVFLAYHLDPSWAGSVQRNSANLRRLDINPDGLSPRSIQLWTLGAGALFIAVVASRHVEPEEIFVHTDADLIPAIFPLVPNGQLRWPPARPLEDTEMHGIADALTLFFEQNPQVAEESTDPQ